MSILNSATYSNDIKTAAAQLDLERLSNKKILVTGASGLICSAIVDMLLELGRTNNAEITVFAAGRNTDKLRERFGEPKNDDLVFVEYDATKDIDLDFSVDFVIHGACNASPDKYVSQPVDTMLANVTGVYNLLSWASKSGLEKFVYISSSEVYGKLAHGNPLKEDEYGSVDILSVRSSYPVGKQAAETLCVGWATQFGTDVSIVRPGHIYGPTALESDNRISSAFARQAARGETLRMKSAGTQIRSYCYCVDCASAILTVLTRGKSMEAYNISNPDSVITIRRMSEILAESAGVELVMDIPSEAEKAAFNPMDNSSLNSEKLESLGWHGQFPAEIGLAHTVKALKEI